MGLQSLKVRNRTPWIYLWINCLEYLASAVSIAGFDMLWCAAASCPSLGLPVRHATHHVHAQIFHDSKSTSHLVAGRRNA